MLAFWKLVVVFFWEAFPKIDMLCFFKYHEMLMYRSSLVCLSLESLKLMSTQFNEATISIIRQ